MSGNNETIKRDEQKCLLVGMQVKKWEVLHHNSNKYAGKVGVIKKKCSSAFEN